MGIRYEPIPRAERVVGSRNRRLRESRFAGPRPTGTLTRVTMEGHERDDEVALDPGTHQDARGVDRSLIRHCLSLTPTQRIAENEDALALIRSVRDPKARGQGATTTSEAGVAASKPHGPR